MRIGRPERAVAKFRHTTDSETLRGPRETRSTLQPVVNRLHSAARRG